MHTVCIYICLAVLQTVTTPPVHHWLHARPPDAFCDNIIGANHLPALCEGASQYTLRPSLLCSCTYNVSFLTMLLCTYTRPSRWGCGLNFVHAVLHSHLPFKTRSLQCRYGSPASCFGSGTPPIGVLAARHTKKDTLHTPDASRERKCSLRLPGTPSR